ncbi:MAG: Dethiobiotin synthetase [Hormoscilla sp. GM7CHS1pb]|nr:Dethiobiotin synthetase [Hormoscilla sp. GM7CHS1pb]
MDYETARRFLINMTNGNNPDTFLGRLQQGEPPIPGQVTSILLSLKVLFAALQGVEALDRELVHVLYQLASEGRQQFDRWRGAGVVWPPLLDQDLTRITYAVRSIYAGVWEDFSQPQGKLSYH